MHILFFSCIIFCFETLDSRSGYWSFFDAYFASFEQEPDPLPLDVSFDDLPPLASKQSSSHSASSASSSCPSEAATPVPPDIGPFLNAIFELLESMLDNDFQVNLQLTGLLAKLAAFPHPLLRSFLLSDSLVCQPSILSLPQVRDSFFSFKFQVHIIDIKYCFLCSRSWHRCDKNLTKQQQESAMFTMLLKKQDVTCVTLHQEHLQFCKLTLRTSLARFQRRHQVTQCRNCLPWLTKVQHFVILQEIAAEKKYLSIF